MCIRDSARTEEPGELTRYIIDYLANETPPPTTAVPARLTSSTDSAVCKCMFAISYGTHIRPDLSSLDFARTRGRVLYCVVWTHTGGPCHHRQRRANDFTTANGPCNVPLCVRNFARQRLTAYLGFVRLRCRMFCCVLLIHTGGRGLIGQRRANDFTTSSGP